MAFRTVAPRRRSNERRRRRLDRMTDDRLSHIVSLARVLVIIRPTPEEAAPEPVTDESGLGTYFRERLDAAWRGGLEALVRTLAAVVEVVIGGLMWWVLLAVALVAGMRRLRRKPGQPGTLAV